MIWKRSRSPKQKRGALTAFVDEGSEIEGTYTFRGTVMLNGRFAGEITSTDTLIVGEKGTVKATIRAGTVQVSGELVGTVTATERIELRSTARLYGAVETPVLVVEDGAIFEGQCRMMRTRPAEATPAGSRDLSIVPGKRTSSPPA